MQHFPEADDGVKWRAQLMAHIGEEMRFRLVGANGLVACDLEAADGGGKCCFTFGNGLRHVDERIGEMAHFISLLQPLGPRVIAARDPAGSSGKLFERPGERANDQHRADKRKDQCPGQQSKNRLCDGKVRRKRFVQRIIEDHEHRRAVFRGRFEAAPSR